VTYFGVLLSGVYQAFCSPVVACGGKEEGRMKKKKESHAA
jgi:hypothetical protein